MQSQLVIINVNIKHYTSCTFHNQQKQPQKQYARKHRTDTMDVLGVGDSQNVEEHTTTHNKLLAALPDYH